jgi:hypothetical protein
MEKNGTSIEILTIVGAALLLAGCGQAPSSSTTAATTETVDCASGYVLDDGSCILESTLEASTGTCLSIADSISFYGSGITADSYGDVYAGVVPDSSTYGTVTVGSSTSADGTSYTGDNEYYAGTISLDVSSSSGAVSGTLNISSYEQELIEEEYGSPCVSGIAIQGQVYTGTTDRFTGTVYVYLNDTDHGVTLSF